jgi:aryl-alcohol dehydrogenase-like predicted oxidoreductase
VIPIPGATRKESILDSLKGADIVLSSEELTQLNGSLPQDLGPVGEELLDQPPFRD